MLKTMRSWRAHLLFALVFLAGQSFAVAHATQHELSPGHQDNCQTCAVAHAGAGTPAAVHFVVAVAPRTEALTLGTAGQLSGCPLSRPRSRAPPSILA